MNWKYAFIALILIIISTLIGGAGVWFLTKSGIPSLGPESATTPTPVPTLGPTVIPTSAPTVPPKGKEEKSTLEQIREAFAQKYSKPISDVEVTVSKDTGTHASGGVKFAGEMGGAWWLGYKGNTGWIVVADGNGTVMCASIEPYNFPVAMVPECWDEATSKLITR